MGWFFANGRRGLITIGVVVALGVVATLFPGVIQLLVGYLMLGFRNLLIEVQGLLVAIVMLVIMYHFLIKPFFRKVIPKK